MPAQKKGVSWQKPTHCERVNKVDISLHSERVNRSQTHKCLSSNFSFSFPDTHAILQMSCMCVSVVMCWLVGWLKENPFCGNVGIFFNSILWRTQISDTWHKIDGLKPSVKCKGP